ncbi:MAG: hypothetical protein R2795_18405 [Saprospiraceae bacterium]
MRSYRLFFSLSLLAAGLLLAGFTPATASMKLALLTPRRWRLVLQPHRTQELSSVLQQQPEHAFR